MFGSLPSYIKLRMALSQSSENIRSLQLRRLNNIVHYAYKNVPFYKNKFDKVGFRPSDRFSFEDFNKIPVTYKEELRLHGKDIISREFKEEELFTSRTSGSTGLPFKSYFDKDAWFILKYASKLRARRACGLKFGAKIVNIEAYNQRETAELNEAFAKRSRFFKLSYLSIFDDIENHLLYFEKFKPDVLYGLPSYFLELGRFISFKHKAWDTRRLIFTSGELLDTHTKKKLKGYFGENVFDIYGGTELKEVAWECRKHSGYHINEDLYYVEVFGGAEDTESSSEGELVVSCLINRAMPLIRYSVGDRARFLNSRCSCGLPFSMLSPISGREVDYFILKNGTKVSPYSLTMTVEPVQGIFQYKIIQHSKQDVELLIVPENTFKKITGSRDSQEILTEAKKLLQGVLGNDVRIKTTLCSRIPLSKNGKYVVVESRIRD